MSQQLPLPFTKPQTVVLQSGADRRRRKNTRPLNAARNRSSDYQYTFDKHGRRVLVGLSFAETQEFELLEAGLPMYAMELHWLELFNKHEHAREALHEALQRNHRVGANSASSPPR
jgi:hypothetical protein